MLECSIYSVCLCSDFRGNGCTGTYTLVSDAVFEATLGAGAGWGAKTGDFGFISDGDLG